MSLTEKILFLTLVFNIELCRGEFEEYPIVMTHEGPVRGKLNFYEDLAYYTFLGIPYAESPEGHLRFRSPLPRKPWKEVLDGTRIGAICPQIEDVYTRDMMDEDCLTVSVFAPVNITEPLSVLVYVYGAELAALSGYGDLIYGPQYFLKRNIIVVQMNYRLGALGFLSLETEEASGNAAIKDVILSLHWVRRNIKRFGGNPQNITLGGNSAGAAIVQLITLTDKAAGLFTKVIEISGSVLSYRFFANNPKINALALAKEMGIYHNDTSTILQNLILANPFEFIDAQEKLVKYDRHSVFRLMQPFVPCIEPDYPEAIITSHPRDIINTGIKVNVSILTGLNTAEGMKVFGSLQENPSLVNHLNENPEVIIPSDLEYPYGSKESINLAQSISKFYFSNKTLNISEVNYENYFDLISDVQFCYSVLYSVFKHLETKDRNALYFYIYGYEGKIDLFRSILNPKYKGTIHGDDITYMFVTIIDKYIKVNVPARDWEMSNTLLDLFTNFIKFGNPTPNFIEPWQECRSDQFKFYSLVEQKNYYYMPFKKRFEFWNKIYNKYYKYVRNGGLVEKRMSP